MKKHQEKNYLCDWRRANGVVSAWLIAEPDTRVEAGDFASAYEKLWDAICLRHGDEEASLTFRKDPPRDPKFQSLFQPLYYTLNTNSVMDFPGDFQDYYENGVCLNCHTPIGRRNLRTLTLEQSPCSDQCLVRNDHASMVVYSEEFIELLGLRRQPVELRSVVIGSASEAGYYEITGAEIVSACGVRTFERTNARKGFECRKCGSRHINYIVPKLAAHLFIARRDLPDRDVILVDDGSGVGSLAICVKAEMWNEMRGKRGTRGIVTGLLGVVPPPEVIANPPLEKN